ncbi:hypothetical protein [Paenibacillus amylolyticus]|uniref:hypothetical protein n=1 Tax=Paenibacillus amylolyticus TaxID=1451 RepID=UPI0039AF6C76
MDQVDWMYESYNQSRSRVGGEWEESVLFLLQLLSVLDQQKEGADEALSQLTDSRHFRHLEKMMWWIKKHLDYEIRLDQIAADVHLYKSYASRIFHEETGRSITDYVTARRLKKAYLLLETTSLWVKRRGRRARFPNGCISSSYFANLPGRARCIIGNNLNGAASIILVCKIIALLRLYTQLVFTV